MKNKILFLLILFLSVSVANEVRAQSKEVPRGKYMLTLRLVYASNYGNTMKQVHFNVDVQINSFQRIWHYDQWFGKMKHGREFWDVFWVSREYDSRPLRLHFDTVREWATGSEWGYSWYDISTDFSIEGLRINRASPFGSIVHVCNSIMEITLLPSMIKFYDAQANEIGQDSDAETKLSEHDLIEIYATRGYYYSQGAKWEYSTNPADPNSWKQFPKLLQRSSSNYEWGDMVRFKGSDLIPDPDEYLALVRSGKMLRVRINGPTHDLRVRQQENPNAEPTTIALDPMLSAPHINSAQIIQHESSPGGRNAVVKITFDRKLEQGEVVNIEAEGRIYEADYANQEIDGDNAIIISKLAGLDEGEVYNFQVVGTFEGYPMYNKAETHSTTLHVPKCPLIHHSAIKSRDVSCNGGQDGQITATASGGIGKFTGRLYKNSVDIANILQQIDFSTGEECIFSGLSEGNYIVEVLGKEGGESDDGLSRITIEQPSAPLSITIREEEVSDAKGYDTRDGQIILRVSGGTQNEDKVGYHDVKMIHESGYPYPTPAGQKDTHTGDIMYVYDELIRGKYTILVQDKNYSKVDPLYQVDPCGCEAKWAEITLAAPDPIVVGLRETHFINWYGGDHGELTVDVSGGKPVTPGDYYHYKWFRQEGEVMRQMAIADENVARNLTAGVYRVEVTDANGITKTSADYILTEPEPIAVQFTVVETGCSGGKSGSIEAFASGGVPPYKYQWNVEGVTENKLTSLETGLYMLKVTDARGGIKSSTVEVGSSSDLNVESLVTQLTCRTLGSVRLRLSGAKPPYTLKWNDITNATSIEPDTYYTRDEMIPGTYRVEITDGNGCRNSHTFVIEEPEIFTVDIGEDLVMCRNQSRLIEAVCEKPDLSYEWYFNGTKLPDTGRTLLVDKAAPLLGAAVDERVVDARVARVVRGEQVVVERGVLAAPDAAEAVRPLGVHRRIEALANDRPLEREVLVGVERGALVGAPRRGAVVDDHVGVVLAAQCVVLDVRLVAHAEAQEAHHHLLHAVEKDRIVAQADAVARGALAGDRDVAVANVQRLFEADGASDREEDDARVLLFERPAQGALRAVVGQRGDVEHLAAATAGGVHAAAFGAGESGLLREAGCG